jgi:hypothetical protein
MVFGRTEADRLLAAAEAALTALGQGRLRCRPDAGA